MDNTTKKERNTPKKWLAILLATENTIDPRHRDSLEAALDRLNEGLSMTPRSKILLAIYKSYFVDDRNQKIAAGNTGKVRKRTRRPPTDETRLKISEGQKLRHAKAKATKAKKG